MLGGLLMAAGLIGLARPDRHTAAGCWWWTATRVGDAVAGSRGCLRGYVVTGGLGEGLGPHEARISYALADPDRPPGRPACPFRPGDRVVVRYHAVFDDGRTLVVIEDCR